MSAIGVLHLVMLEAFAFTLITGGLASLAVRPLARVTAAWSPESRHRAWLVFALAPLMLSLAGLVATFLPSLLGLLWAHYDHCLEHPGTHVHLCLVHLPTQVGNTGSWLVIVVASFLFSIRAGKASVGLNRASGLRRRFVAHGRHEPALAAWVLRTEQPFCVSVGVFRPTILISDGLIGGVTSEQLRAVLAHEQAHVARRDTLFRLFARAATICLWPAAREQVLRAVELAAEQSCDEAAASLIGDRLVMAEVILKVERLLGPVPQRLAPLAVSFGGTAVELRVSALLESRRRETASISPVFVLVLLVLALLAVSEPLHHLTETLLGALTQ